MTRDKVIWWLALTILLCGFAFAFGWAAKPPEKAEPETWCPKRMLGFFLYSEKLELNTATQEGLLTCRLMKTGATDDMGRKVTAK